MESKRSYRKTFKFWVILGFFSLSVYYIWLLFNAGNLKTINFFVILVFSHLCTIVLIWVIVELLLNFSSRRHLYYFSKIRSHHRVSDFFIGDNGGYSLVRVQVVLWAITIISYQIAVLLTLLLPTDSTGSHSYVYYYELDFSESILWLLGLSLTSYVSVKGITAEQTQKVLRISNTEPERTPEPIDIISGMNGLDFSKCQMAIWTLIAIVLFNSHVFTFNKAIYFQGYAKNAQGIVDSFTRYYEEYSENERKQIYDPTKPFVPYLPWAFIILMGLSHGAYIGKKLVPDHKVESVQQGLRSRISEVMEGLIVKKELFSRQLEIVRGQVLSTRDQQYLDEWQNEIFKMERLLSKLNLELEKIEKLSF